MNYVTNLRRILGQVVGEIVIAAAVEGELSLFICLCSLFIYIWRLKDS